MISYLLPTRDRPDELRRTLAALERLPERALARCGGGEVVIADNDSEPPVVAAGTLANGLAVHVVTLDGNRGAAARNDGAVAARGEWLVMLDDDSAPLDHGHVDVLVSAPDDVAAIGAEIMLPDGSREAGGLPEVFVGCGAAVRRDAFLDVGGYDAAFGFYAEEYDLCARLLLSGWRVVHDRRFRVLHRKVARGRNMDLIVQRLVRNNGWVMQRYAPRDRLAAELDEVITRYRQVAARESAESGFDRGADELAATIGDQPHRVMHDTLFDRFKGVTAAREGLGNSPELCAGEVAAVVEPGKHDGVVRQVLAEMRAPVASAAEADVLVVGTLSPGPMLDAAERMADRPVPVVCPWRPNGARPSRTRGAGVVAS